MGTTKSAVEQYKDIILSFNDVWVVAYETEQHKLRKNKVLLSINLLNPDYADLEQTTTTTTTLSEKSEKSATSQHDATAISKSSPKTPNTPAEGQITTGSKLQGSSDLTTTDSNELQTNLTDDIPSLGSGVET